MKNTTFQVWIFNLSTCVNGEEKKKKNTVGVTTVEATSTALIDFVDFKIVVISIIMEIRGCKHKLIEMERM